MKDWVTPFKETAANIKATASLLKEMFCLRACRTVKHGYCLSFPYTMLNFFFLRYIIFIDFHEMSVRTIQKYLT